MKVVLLESPAREIVIPGGAIYAEPGVAVEVPADLGKRVLEQDVWGVPAKEKD